MILLPLVTESQILNLVKLLWSTVLSQSTTNSVHGECLTYASFRARGPIAVIGPGTGLGVSFDFYCALYVYYVLTQEAFMLWDHKRESYIVVPTEV